MQSKEKAQRLEGSPVQSQHITTEPCVSKHREFPVRPPLVLTKVNSTEVLRTRFGLHQLAQAEGTSGTSLAEIGSTPNIQGMKSQAPNPLPYGPPGGTPFHCLSHKLTCIKTYFQRGLWKWCFWPLSIVRLALTPKTSNTRPGTGIQLVRFCTGDVWRPVTQGVQTAYTVREAFGYP